MKNVQEIEGRHSFHARLLQRDRGSWSPYNHRSAILQKILCDKHIFQIGHCIESNCWFSRFVTFCYVVMDISISLLTGTTFQNSCFRVHNWIQLENSFIYMSKYKFIFFLLSYHREKS